MTRLAGVFGVLPEHRYAQAELTRMFADIALGPDANYALVERLHANAKVNFRHLSLPMDSYRTLDDFGIANDAFIAAAIDLGVKAVEGALTVAGIRPDEVDFITSTTVTGVCAPSIEARIAHRVGLRPDVKRVPMFGLGCVAGAAGVARVHDYLLGHPDDVAVLLSVELCSLTVQRSDRSTANLVASGLFGDGASAVVALGEIRAQRSPTSTGPRVVDSRSHLYPNSERTMGWDVGAGGLKIVLDAQVPQLVERYLGEDVREFLKIHDLATSDVRTWVSHPGGPKVIEAIEKALDLTDGELQLTWDSLAAVGNLSSSSVLHVLRDTIAATPPGSGEPAMLMAMGPGFCSELVLLEW